MNIGNLIDFILYDLATFWFYKTLSFLEPIIIIIIISASAIDVVQ